MFDHILSFFPMYVYCSVESNGVVSSGGGSDGGRVTSGGGGGSEYLKQLQALNVGVSKWISSHVEKNPHVDLTPIFKDYEKHLKAIDMKVWHHVVCRMVGREDPLISSVLSMYVPTIKFLHWGGETRRIASPYGT